MNSLNSKTNELDGRKVKYFGVEGKLSLFDNGQQFVFVDDKSGDSKTLTFNEVAEKLGSQIIPISQKNTFQEHHTLTLAQQIELDRRKKYIDEFYKIRVDGKFGGIQFFKDITARIAHEIGDKNPPCRTQYIRWLKKSNDHISGAMSTLGLHRKRKSSIFNDEVKDFALECMDNYYLKLGKPTMQFAYDSFVGDCKKTFPDDTNLPSYKTFTNWVKNLAPDEVTLKRDGKRALRASKRNKTSKLITNHILERVESDAVHFSMGAIDDDGNYLDKVIGYFTLDCNSRSILGYKLQIGTGENPDSVIECYLNALIEIDPREKCAEVKNNWPMCGLFETNVIDGGPGYNATTSMDFLNRLGITTQIAQTGCGWRKPYIERFFSTLRQQLLQSMSGYCRRVKDARELDLSLEKQACFTLREIESLLTQWIVDEYHQTPHSGLNGSTPYEHWIDQAPMYLILPPNEDKLRLMLGESTQRTILGADSEGGIVYENIAYNDLNGRLQQIAKLKKMNGDSPTIQIRYSNNDISRMSAIDEETGELIELIATDPNITEGMSLIEYKTRFKSKKYLDKGFGHDRVTRNSLVRNGPDHLHSAKMKSSHHKTPRAAKITTLENTVEAECLDITDEEHDDSFDGIPTVKAHEDA